MKSLALLSIFILSSCIQSSNSSSSDRLFSEDIDIDTSTPQGVRLFNAYIVLRRNCISCHKGEHSHWSSNFTDEAWMDYIEAGNADGSELVLQLQNRGGEMPQEGEQLSDEDFEKILDWINGIPST